MGIKAKVLATFFAAATLSAVTTGVSAAAAVDEGPTAGTPEVGALAWGSIKTRLNGRCLDADANTLPNNGTKVQLWDCNGTSQQSWELRSVGNGYYTIHIRWSGKCLDADANNGGNGTKVQIWDCNGSAQQRWYKYGESGTSRFVNDFSWRCLDADANAGGNGTKVQLWDCNGAPQQGWY
ncbi:hypothetical protein GCM10022243_36610 [Saccharothrix violaceirubra]|uniref:Ricin B lectin domain-containing protein n=1 Tax=Saccharothrix violaceirubra TaxID=413306 RepID=A0A7W7WXB4_9PSEU|nr:RICIN domain-containing protein [Saccharothrix violaceirubra]MBB4966423.1 hypothetical protein [Saccharothrix violaceirubra]